LEADSLERSLRNTNAHATLVLEPQVEFTASQVRTLKDFFADFFDKPATSNEARALARETIDALKDLEIELVELNAQKALYPFLGVLDAALVTLKEVAEKNVNWFLTDLARAQDALLDSKETLIDPLRRFMKSPQKAIFDQARQLVADQEDNFAYVPSAEVDMVQVLLADKRPWQGNRLQQAKTQLDALQQRIANQLASEKATAANRLDELAQRLQGTDEYMGLSPDDQAKLTKPFFDARQVLQSQKRIAMIRDQLRHFEDEHYPRVLLQLEGLAEPKPVTPPPIVPAGATQQSDSGEPVTTTPPPHVAEPRLVPARTIKVGYAKPWLASESELDDYLQQQREAWLKEIRAGNRVQV
jgi:hypothetical protein